ncbi:vp1054 [Peridroma alphabaculovirus]|uniref:Vp1054 n=1 Tax=Peridroma alphabaculovirus TaxID=1346829 RepID=A0A068LKG6_9ABAC|nr:vp1054 [Peridroma alphabaculovirus]AIE47777.1 vp1054 [Peridroma alphabaculovirus]
MSSTTSLVRFNQCVSEKLTPFRPIKLPSAQCPIHPLRANCRAIRRYDTAHGDAPFINHVTAMSAVYQDYDRVPYFMCLVNENTDPETRGAYLNANELLAYVHLQQLDDDEHFMGIDEAGERNMATLRNVIKGIMDAFAACADRVVLMVDELQLDVVYSIFRCVVLPQRMVALYLGAYAPLNDDVAVFGVPGTDAALECQLIYRTFLMYNTVLTMLLKQRNPFNEPKKNISVIFRTLGKCPNNKERVKCCDLRYGGAAPGHIMCPPRLMVKKIFHYAKWARSPNNYRRYFELIVTPPVPRQKYQQTGGGDGGNAPNEQLVVMDWYNFIDDFRAYFGIVLA